MGALVRAPFLSFLFAVLLAQSALADKYFETLRYNSLTPKHCQEFDINFFDQNITWITYGIVGSKQVGFTHEYPINREEARLAWYFIRENNYHGKTGNKQLDTKRMQYFLTLLEQARHYMGYEYRSEGEILEALALIDLTNYYNPKEYFFTGSISYSRGHGPVVGELDIIVARRDNCHVVVIGESKLGSHRLSKAREQLQRFHRFLTQH